MALKDFVATSARRYKPIQSVVPDTTLDPIQIDAFHGEGKLRDTPEMHLHHQQVAFVHTEDFPLLAPQSRLKGSVVSINALTKENQGLFYTSKATSCTLDNGLNGLSIFCGGLVRIDVVKVPLLIRLIIYRPKGVQIKLVPTYEAKEFYHRDLEEMMEQCFFADILIYNMPLRGLCKEGKMELSCDIFNKIPKKSYALMHQLMTP